MGHKYIRHIYKEANLREMVQAFDEKQTKPQGVKEFIGKLSYKRYPRTKEISPKRQLTTLQMVSLESRMCDPKFKTFGADNLTPVDAEPTDASAVKVWTGWTKTLAINLVMFGLLSVASYAGLDDQLEAANDMIFGTGSKVAFGSSFLFGAYQAVVKGNVPLGISICVVTLAAGFGMSTIADGEFLKGLK